MSTILNPTPVTFAAVLLPFDGTNLLATGRKVVATDVSRKSADALFNTMLSAMETELARQSGNESGLVELRVTASDPARPVAATVSFADGKRHTIRDCFALCGTDPTFAAAFSGAMVEIARQAGLSVQ
jgi:ribosomal protein S12 methylthiotransferase accessory factor YcaO